MPVAPVHLRNNTRSLIIKHLSNKYRRHDFLNDILLVCGLTGRDVEFIYIPHDVNYNQSKGYAHVSFRTSDIAAYVGRTLHGGQFQRYPTHKVIHVEASRLQGVEKIVANFDLSRDKYSNPELCPVVFTANGMMLPLLTENAIAFVKGGESIPIRVQENQGDCEGYTDHNGNWYDAQKFFENMMKCITANWDGN